MADHLPALAMHIAHRSEIGDRQANQDVLRVARIGTMGHMVLSDGAGGHERGIEAARRTVDTIDSVLADLCAAGQAPNAHDLREAIRAAHRELQSHQQGSSAHEQMHATVTALWVDRLSRQAVWAHVGDTRLYHLRAGRLVHTTTDDSVVQSMVDAGWLTPAQARSHPHKNHLLAALGMSDAVDPHAGGCELADDDAFLLCTDGWWDPVDEVLRTMLWAAAVHPQQWLQQLHEHIRAHRPPRQDNHSAIAVSFGAQPLDAQ
jgi:serine/threonine protein phosphatase PrpC